MKQTGIDEEVIRRINCGDTNAFGELYKAYYVYLCAVATKYVFDPEAAQEIVNDVFLNVWHHRFTLTSPVTAYLIRGVQNRSLNHLQRKRMKELPLSDVQEQLLTICEQAVTADEHPLAYLENLEFEKHIAEAVEALPDRCKTIFKQYLYQNRTYEEIAHLNDITSSTVRGQIRIALSKVGESIRKYYITLLWGYIL